MALETKKTLAHTIKMTPLFLEKCPRKKPNLGKSMQQLKVFIIMQQWNSKYNNLDVEIRWSLDQSYTSQTEESKKNISCHK